jgi:hypothetical protein
LAEEIALIADTERDVVALSFDPLYFVRAGEEEAAVGADEKAVGESLLV